jgi:hypothetical protein
MPVDVEAVAAATSACPSVARLASGGMAEVATYLPGRRVLGVRAREEEVEVHVVGRWEVPVPEVANEVRAAVSPLSGGLPVGVYIDDIDIPPSVLGVEEPPTELPPVTGPGVVSAGSRGVAGAGLPGENLTTGLEPTQTHTVPGEVATPGDPAVEGVRVLPGEAGAPSDPLLEEATPVDPVLPEQGLPLERGTEELVVEDEVPGDVIPGEPAPPPKSRPRKAAPKEDTPGDLG